MTPYLSLIWAIVLAAGVVSRITPKLFSIQKRCVRLLFGSKPSLDRAEYYETCARARPYSEHIAKRSFASENTKPIFNTEKIMSIHNLYTQHISTELFKILKLHQPISLSSLFQKISRTCSQTMRVPLHKLDISKHNFVVKGTTIWNSLVDKIFDKCTPNENDIMVPGSSKFSDLSSPISIIKSRIKKLLKPLTAGASNQLGQSASHPLHTINWYFFSNFWFFLIRLSEDRF